MPRKIKTRKIQSKKLINTHPSDFRHSTKNVFEGSDLLKKYRLLEERSKKLEELVGIISRGKYQWEATFDAITAPVMIVSKDYRVERANVNFASVSGEDITKVAGKNCYEVFAGRKTPCDNCPLKKSVSEDSPRTRFLGNKIRDREFEAHAYPYILEGSKADAAVMYYRDVTEERRLQQEAIQQEKMAAIGLLAGGVAHEINNPLGGILAFTQLLIRDAKDNESLCHDLKEIESAAIRCKKIVSDLLDFSRVSKEREKCLVDVNLLIEKVIPFIRGDLTSLNIELVFEPEKKISFVKGNPDRIQQVFLNLLTNACHAMPRGGVLTIKTKSREDKGVRITVSDTGMGISKENMSRVFEPFFTTKDVERGTGLGLSIAYRIVKEHGGAIEVDSEEGKGTTFTVYFPGA